MKLTGRRVDPVRENWLLGPIGDTKIIGDTFIDQLAQDEALTRVQNKEGFGLIDDLKELDLSAVDMKKLRPEVQDFYENTFNYDIEFWSEWKGLFKPFGFLISILFSKRLQQLNLPLNMNDAAKGLESNIVKLLKGNETIWTIWYRKLRSNNNVIYSGIYTSCKPEFNDKPFLKVIFPLPNGNGTVLMDSKVDNDGALILSSEGTTFGQSGFYFTLTDKKGNYWAKRVRTMHEWIKVYVDDLGALRANHKMNLWGLRFMNLHYKMTLK